MRRFVAARSIAGYFRFILIQTNQLIRPAASIGRAPQGQKPRRCGRHALARIRLCSRRSCEEMGVANGERQIEIAGRGAGVVEEARAD